jgi:DNA polymerase-3 subunit delta
VLYVFHGEDEFRAHEALRELRRQLDRDGNLAHNTVRFDEQEVRSLTPAALRAACHTASFFEESRLVIVEGLLKRLGGGGRRRGRRSRGAAETAGPASEADEFLEVLGSLPETTTVVLLDVSAGSAMLEALPEGTAVRGFPHFRRAEEMRGWAAERAKAAGASFAPGAFERLLALIDGAHTGEMAGEIDKLVTYAAGRPITQEDVEELVSGVREYMPWDLTDAVIEGRADKALAVLRATNLKDRPPIVLSAMLINQYRRLLLTQALLREGVGQSQIGAELRISGYPLQKAVEQASRYPAEALEAAYRRLLESDVAVKTGVLDADAALEVVIVTLAELARTPRRAAIRR